MEIPKDKIIEMIKEHGNADQAGQAEQELPDQVDPDRDSGLLSKFGLEPKDLIGKLGGLPGL
jgi:hypothetical protein